MTSADGSRAQSNAASTSEIRSVDVAVVGGGLSGLAAAHKLARAGKSVVVLEASDRTGGRVQNAVVGGAICELGGEWASSFQPHIQALLAELDIETFEFYTAGKGAYVSDGKVTRFEPPLLPLPAAVLAEVAAAIAQFDLMADEIPVDAPWTAPQAAQWDGQTLTTWLDDNIMTAGARDTLDVMGAGRSARRHASCRSCTTSSS